MLLPPVLFAACRGNRARLAALRNLRRGAVLAQGRGRGKMRVVRRNRRPPRRGRADIYACHRKKEALRHLKGQRRCGKRPCGRGGLSLRHRRRGLRPRSLLQKRRRISKANFS